MGPAVLVVAGGVLAGYGFVAQGDDEVAVVGSDAGGDVAAAAAD